MYILFLIVAIVDWLWYTVSSTSLYLIIPLLSDLNMTLQVRTFDERTTFLTSVGIPSAAAETYAIKFTENCLTNLGLQDLDKTILNSLNHTVLGDQLTILDLAKHCSNTAPSQQPFVNQPNPLGLQKSNCISICQTSTGVECLHHYQRVTNTRLRSTPL